MAALRAALARPGRQCLFKPPSHRGPLLRRHISSSTSSNYETIARLTSVMIDGSCSFAYSMLEAIHSTGMSWVFAIPLAAVIVRCGIVLPFISIPARKVQQRFVLITPVVAGWKAAVRRHVWGTNTDLTPPVMQQIIEGHDKNTKHLLYMRWKCQWWRRAMPFLSVPFFLTLAETIRRMVGSRPGLLGMLAGDADGQTMKSTVGTAVSKVSSGELGHNASPTAEPISAASADTLTPSASITTSTDTLADAATTLTPDTFTEPVAITAETLQNAITNLQTAFPINILQNHPWDWTAPFTARQAYLDTYLDPSLTTEGALWFTDLTAADPTLILPFIVSGITFAHIAYGSRLPSGVKISAASGFLRRGLLVLSLSLWALIMNVPSGILLYWASSTAAAFANALFLDWRLPLGKMIAPAKRMMPPFESTRDLPTLPVTKLWRADQTRKDGRSCKKEGYQM